VVEHVRRQLITVFASAPMGDGQPTPRHQQLGELLADVCATDPIAVVRGHVNGAKLHRRLVLTIDVLTCHMI
jgi:hypothetical protein